MNGQMLEELLRAFVRVEHAQLQVQDGFTGDGETKMTGLNGPGVNRSNGNLKNAFSQSRPVFVLLAFKGRQDLAQGKVFSQRVNVRPIVVQRNTARIRMSGRFQAKPVV